MKKINFTNATVTAQASVEINGESHDVTPAVIEGGTLPTPDNINQLQNNVEEAILNPVVESIECKNKFDMNGNILESIGYTSGTNTLESGKIKSTANIANGNGKGQIIQLKPNTVYTYSVKISGFEVSGSTCLRISPVNSEGNAVGYLVDQTVICEVGKVYSYSFTTSDTGKIWVMLNGISNSDDYSILKYIVYDYVQIEEGSTATSYTPFKRYSYDSQESMGKIVVDDIRSKNLFNLQGSYTCNINSSTISGNSIILPSSDGNGGYTKFSQKIEVNDSLTLSCTISDGNGYARLLLIPLDSSGNVITDLTIEGYSYNQFYAGYWKECADGKYSLTLNFPSNVKFLQLGFIHVSAKFTDIQIEEGSTATNYSEYKGIGYTSGSNANGSWVKYDDGRLECWGKASIPANQKNTTITFPIPFLEPNKNGAGTNINISITDIYTYNYYNVYTVAEFTNNNFKVFAFTADGGTPTVQRDFFFNVKGFWK